MKFGWRAALAACILASSTALTLAAGDRGVTLIGTGFIPGTVLDLSGLDHTNICSVDDATNCIDRATFGGFGSAIAYTGHDNVFLAVPDRGPFDGRTDVPYLDRFHFLQITIDTSKTFDNIATTILDTRFLKNESNKNFVGNAYAFDTDNPSNTLRFDPEGIAIGRDGTFFISDEYGPYIFQFDRQGHILQRIAVPAEFLLRDPPLGNPSGDLDKNGNSFELSPAFNTTGRQANRGMEGLAITPDGRWLVGIMQNALLQDAGWDAIAASRVGKNNRILKYNLETGEKHEYVYKVDAINQGRGVNDMLALNDHQFLVLERDNRTFRPTPPAAPSDPRLKQLYLIDLNKPGLTDVTGNPGLPADALGAIVLVDKKPFLNMLDTTYVVDKDGHTIKDIVAEKIEGIAWGPDLPDGRHTLLITSDNDLFPGNPTQIYAFAIDASVAGANVDYQPQELPGPLFAPGQLKKK